MSSAQLAHGGGTGGAGAAKNRLYGDIDVWSPPADSTPRRAGLGAVDPGGSLPMPSQEAYWLSLQLWVGLAGAFPDTKGRSISFLCGGVCRWRERVVNVTLGERWQIDGIMSATGGAWGPALRIASKVWKVDLISGATAKLIG
jgi:hypothetical protein